MTQDLHIPVKNLFLISMQANEGRRLAHRLRTETRPIGSYEYIQSVIDRLRLAKEMMTYSEMESVSGVHSTLLCRYVTGSIRPSRDQAETLERTILGRSGFKDRLKEKMVIVNGGYLDLHLLVGDPSFLRWISGDVTSQFSDLKCDRILTAASSGIALATAIAMHFGVPIVYATNTKSSGLGPYFEADLHSQNPSEISTLYIPSSLLREGDSVIIVDDVATSGRTMSGLVELVRKAGCKLEGIFVLASRSKLWREKITRTISDKPARILVYFEMDSDGRRR
jgi:adenine phosphoribosyltransferase